MDDLSQSTYHSFTIFPFKADELNEVFVQKLSAEALELERKDYLSLDVVSIETGNATFIQKDKDRTEVCTWLTQQNDYLRLSCSCDFTANKLCRHEARALYNVSQRRDLRLFFDHGMLHAHLRKFAEAYGLQDEYNLADYFSLEFVNNKALVTTSSPSLLALNRETTSLLQDELLGSRLRTRMRTADRTQMFVVFRQHKYYKHLIVDLLEAQLTQSGKPKNPFVAVGAIDQVWTAETPAEAKFFSALNLFEQRTSGENPVAALEALKAIVKNPSNLPFFSHNPASSENVTASSLVPLSLGSTAHDLVIQVEKKRQFFELGATLTIDGLPQSLDRLPLKHEYFVEQSGTLHLANDIRIIKIINLFHEHQHRLLIHESRFEEFRENVLTRLEESTEIHYNHLPHASKEQMRESGLNSTPEKLLYLSESDPYIELNPVMKYGDIEIPILSKKQIFQKSIRNTFRIERDKEAETEFIALLIRQHPFFEEQLDDSLPFFYLHKKRFLAEDWFLNTFEEWQQKGIQIMGFNKLKGNKLNPNKAKITVRIQSGTDWFDADVMVRYGNKRARLQQVKKALRNKSKYVQLDDGTLGIFPEEWIKKFEEYFNSGAVVNDCLKIPKTNFTALENLFEQEMLDLSVQSELAELNQKVRDFEAIEEVLVPPALNAELRKYQKQGLNWLNFLDSFNFGGCLADDMGLGKSVQILAFILSQREKCQENTNLLVVPTSLIFSWEHEISKFAPSLKVLQFFGASRQSNTSGLEDYELVITSYGVLLADIRILKNFKFNYVFLDESQQIKNPDSQRHKAACLLKSRNRIAITGTPVENNTFDLFGQLSFACPGLLGTRQYFRDIYAVPIDQFKDRRRARELQNKIRPFILRRTKKQVAAELPEKTAMVLFCGMAPEQQKIYDAYEREFRDYICSKTEEELPPTSVHVLKGITRLRQICNSPLLLNDDDISIRDSGKMQVLMEQLLSKSPHHKILVFSQFVSMLDLVRKELAERGIAFSYLTGATRDRQQVVEEFQSDKSKRIFLISLKAGGTGLNLTQADYVYLIDPWWNPAVENQAIDRIYRIGQKKNVVAVRLIAQGTVEEKIMNLQETKKELFDDLVKAEGGFLKALSRERLLELLG